MWIAAAIPAVQTAAGYIDTTNNKDPERFAQSQAWYAAAIVGDAKALCHLKYMGGLRNCAPGGCAGVAACGFATNVAKEYNETLYQRALAVLGGLISPASPIPPAPQPSGAGQTVGTVAQQGSELLGGIATGLGKPPQPTGQSVLAYATGFAPWIIVGVGALVLYAVIKGVRR